MKDGEMFIPDTVGELIELLKKFPADYDINFYIRNVYDNGSVYDESAYRMKVEEYSECRCVNLTVI